MKRYGCIYKSEQGIECLVIRDWKEEYKKCGSIIFDGKVLTEEYK